MATFSDTFTRADSTDLGSVWDSGYTSMANLQIVGNRVRASAADSVDKVESYNGASLGNDQFARVTLATLATANNVAGVILRAAAPSTVTWYWYYALGGASSGSAIAKEVNGAFTSLSTDTTMWSGGDTLTGVVMGTTQRMFRNGGSLLNSTDSAISAGRIGLSIKTDNLANAELDDVFGGDLSTTTLRPAGDGTTTGWTRVEASGTFASKIVDDPDSNDGDTSYVMAPNVTDSQMWVTLDATPSDFDLGVQAAIKASAKKVEGGVSQGADTVNLFLQLERSDESTDITAESAVCNVTGTASYTTFDRTVAVSGTHTKTNWDAARLKLRQDYTAAGMADTTAQIRITAAEVLVYYVPTVPAGGVTIMAQERGKFRRMHSRVFSRVN